MVVEVIRTCTFTKVCICPIVALQSSNRLNLNLITHHHHRHRHTVTDIHRSTCKKTVHHAIIVTHCWARASKKLPNWMCTAFVCERAGGRSDTQRLSPIRLVPSWLRQVSVRADLLLGCGVCVGMGVACSQHEP